MATRIVVLFKEHNYKVEPETALKEMPAGSWVKCFEDEDGWVCLEFQSMELAASYLNVLEGEAK